MRRSVHRARAQCRTAPALPLPLPRPACLAGRPSLPPRPRGPPPSLAVADATPSGVVLAPSAGSGLRRATARQHHCPRRPALAPSTPDTRRYPPRASPPPCPPPSPPPTAHLAAARGVPLHCAAAARRLLPSPRAPPQRVARRHPAARPVAHLADAAMPACRKRARRLASRSALPPLYPLAQTDALLRAAAHSTRAPTSARPVAPFTSGAARVVLTVAPSTPCCSARLPPPPRCAPRTCRTHTAPHSTLLPFPMCCLAATPDRSYSRPLHPHLGCGHCLR